MSSDASATADAFQRIDRSPRKRQHCPGSVFNSIWTCCISSCVDSKYSCFGNFLANTLMNKERGIIVAVNAISFIFAPNSVVDLDFPLKKVDTYSSSFAFVGGFKDVERFPSKSVQSNCWRALRYKLRVCKFSFWFSKIVDGKIWWPYFAHV